MLPNFRFIFGQRVEPYYAEYLLPNHHLVELLYIDCQSISTIYAIIEMNW